MNEDKYKINGRLDTTDYTQDVETLDAYLRTEKKAELEREAGVRQMRIRALLASRVSYEEGITSIQELADLVGASSSTIAKDLEVIPWVKIKLLGDEVRGGKVRKVRKTIYALLHPQEAPNGTRPTPQSVVANKIAIVLYDNKLYINRFRDQVIVKTERGAGELVGMWLKELRWPDIVYTICDSDTVVIQCVHEQGAIDTEVKLQTRDIT